MIVEPTVNSIQRGNLCKIGVFLFIFTSLDYGVFNFDCTYFMSHYAFLFLFSFSASGPFSHILITSNCTCTSLEQ